MVTRPGSLRDCLQSKALNDRSCKRYIQNIRGGIDRAGMIIHDKTERKHIEKELIKAKELAEKSGTRMLNIINDIISILKVSTELGAVEVCRKNPDIDLILMDIKMPEMDGYEATRKIREFNKKVKIIAQTAYALNGDREKALASGCDDYVSKPLNQAILNKILKKLFKQI